LRWLLITAGILALIAGIATFVWPDITIYVVSIFLAWYLILFGIMHVVNALAGHKQGWWWTELLLGIAEIVLGAGAVMGTLPVHAGDARWSVVSTLLARSSAPSPKGRPGGESRTAAADVAKSAPR
jgi:uncharacterized membrane protein HdeD (DUF308 family)